ncbi:MAG: hypothetical protein VX619_06020 [bacterium]|nr:hypothetical protein [bacterium]
MSLSILYKILRIVAVISASNAFHLSFANFQSDSKTELNKIIKLRSANLNSFNEFRSKKEESFRYKKEQDKLNRRSLLRKQSLPKSFGVKKKGQAVFVSNELLHANIGSIQNIFRGTKLSPSKKPNGSTVGYFIKSTKRGSFVSLLGFEAGDVIHKVDKYNIVSMSSIFKAYRRILKKKPEKIVVIYSSMKTPTVKRVLTFFRAHVEGQ